MRNRLVMLIIVAAALVALALPATAGVEGKSIVLGERGISNSRGLDFVTVNVRRGDVAAIKLVVKGHDVQFREVIVHFASGPDQKIPLTALVAAGGESTAMPLAGGNRVVRSVELRYEPGSFAGKWARVAVYGLF